MTGEQRCQVASAAAAASSNMPESDDLSMLAGLLEQFPLVKRALEMYDRGECYCATMNMPIGRCRVCQEKD